MRSIKEEFVVGSWNINAIMLGGLGKDPLSEGDIAIFTKHFI